MRRAVVVCAHLRPGRTKRRSKHFMQPITGLHIASLIDPDRFDVALHHEDWHGPYDTRSQRRYDLVFLTGLQADFDRMRQLSFHFRRLGATVVAGGSICTLFPEFAAQFFDAVCVGGVDSVPTIVADLLNCRLQPIYRSPPARISSYMVDYRLFARNGIKPQSHLLEASRLQFPLQLLRHPGREGAIRQLSAIRRCGGDRWRTGDGAMVEPAPLVSHLSVP